MSKSVRITSNLPQWIDSSRNQMDTVVAEIATDVHKRAVMNAPVDTRALVNSGRIQRIAKGVYAVIFGNSRVPYARYRHFINRRNPQTLGYLSRAGDSVYRGNLTKYFRNLP